MISTTVSEQTQPTETNPITLPLHNWEALHQLEKEQDSLVLQGTVSTAVAAGTGVFGNPVGFFIFALAYSYQVIAGNRPELQGIDAACAKRFSWRRFAIAIPDIHLLPELTHPTRLAIA